MYLPKQSKKNITLVVLVSVVALLFLTYIVQEASGSSFTLPDDRHGIFYQELPNGKDVTCVWARINNGEGGISCDWESVNN